MNLSAIYHKSTDNFCYQLNENQLMINLKTGYDITKVYIYFDDPYTFKDVGPKEKWITTKLEITNTISLTNHKLWSIILEPEFKRLIYFFEIVSEDDTYFYFENKFIRGEDFKNNTSTVQCFCFPWMNKSDIYTVPRWVTNTLWYQIFLDRFNRVSNDNSSVQPWAKIDDPITSSDFYGGNLQGIIKKLDYLKSLGISGIYLTPITDSISNHRYDVTDYYKVDPRLGSEQDLKDLIKEAHNRDIKIMLDAVFNHSGINFEPWKDVVKNGPNSKYFDWFMVNKWPFDKSNNSKNGNYYTFSFYDVMPKLNTNNPEVINYFINVCKYYISNFDIDGMRFDVANEVSHTFWKELRRVVKKMKPEFYLLGEIWNNATPWLRGDEFDSVMNYPISYSFYNFWKDSTYTKKDFEISINECFYPYTHQSKSVMFNLLDSHDTARLTTTVGSEEKALQMLTLLLAMPGSPCIFYGTELLLTGNEDPDCRKCMPWADIDAGKYDDILNKIKNIIALRNDEPLFRCNHFYFNQNINNDRVIEFIKEDTLGNNLEIILNCSEKDVELNLDKEILFSNLLEGNILQKDGILIFRGDLIDKANL